MFHILYLECPDDFARHLLRHTQGLTWHGLQARFDDYKTSLGPWTVDEVLQFLRDDLDWTPEIDSSIQDFAASDDEMLEF